MSDQYEPSYYEIALTGRQVLVAFVVLLVCLVAAFFSGVWVGREGGEGGGRESPQEVRAEDAEPGLEELSFFEEEPVARPRGAGAEEDVAPGPRPEPSLREDGEDADRPAAGRDAGAEERGPAVPPRPAPTEEPPRPEPERRPPPARPEASPSGSLATGDVVIQVFSSSEEAKARDVLARLEKNGFRAFLSPVVDDGRTLYRVRVGPFEHRSEAEAVAERLRSSLNMETWITQ